MVDVLLEAVGRGLGVERGGGDMQYKAGVATYKLAWRRVRVCADA